MKNMKISLKLLVTFSIVMILMITCIVTALVSLNEIGTEVDSYIEGPVATRNAANRMDSSFEYIQKLTYRSIATDSVAEVEAFDKEIQAESQTLQQELQTVRQSFAGDPSLLTAIEKCLSEMEPHRAQVMSIARELKNAEAYAYMEQHNVPIITQAQGYIDEIITFAEQRNQTMVDSVHEVQSRSLFLLIAMGVVSLVVSVGFGFYITRGISRPVRELEQAAQSLSGGILNVQIEYQSKDELGELASNMRDMAATLRTYIGDIGNCLSQLSHGNLTATTTAEFKGDFVALRNDIGGLLDSLNSTMSMISNSAGQVSAGSEQVSDASQTLAEGATEQASSVQQLSASITEISAQVKATAESASVARLAVTEAGDRVQECNTHMNSLTGAMEDISSKSQEIGKIIKTIDDIAFQTNILALNAAVEAARAGQHGKGFAVVADEVRNLAAKSAEAASDTTVLIESSVTAVQRGSELAAQTAKSLQQVTEKAEETSESVQQIARAAEEQSLAVAQVTQGVDQISVVVQANAATAEQSAAASEELSGQAQVLREQVRKFKIKDQDGSSLYSHEESPAVRRNGQAHDASGMSLTSQSFDPYGSDKY